VPGLHGNVSPERPAKMLDAVAIIILLIILTFPVTICIFDRWGFEEAGNRRD
jgi:hypothetical protein